MPSCRFTDASREIESARGRATGGALFSVVSPQADGVLYLCGELDLAAAPQLVQELAAARSTCRGTLTIDLDELSFCGCIGLSILLAEHERRAAAGSRLELVHASRQMLRILALVKLDGVFNIDSAATRPAMVNQPQARR